MVVQERVVTNERQALLPTTAKYGSIVVSHDMNGHDDNKEGTLQTQQKTITSWGRWQLLVGMFATFIVLGQILVMLLLRNRRYATTSPYNNNHVDCVWTNLHCEYNNDNNNDENEDKKEQQQHATTCWISPTEYETCLQTIKLDTAHFVQSVQALEDVFAAWYPFLNQAAHPLQTRPCPTTLQQRQNKYQIYPNAVDLPARLAQIRQGVVQKSQNRSISSGGGGGGGGAVTMASFWRVSQAFNLLRDAHVNAIKGPVGNLTSNFWSGWYDLAVFPPETWDAMTMTGQQIRVGDKDNDNVVALYKAVFYYDTPVVDDMVSSVTPGWENDGAMDNPEKNDATALRLNIERYNAKGNLLETRRVYRLDGMAPGDFVVRMAKYAPLRSLALRSIGPRVNSLLHRNFATTHPQPTFFRLARSENIVPHHLFPQDSLDVEYDSGSKETFHVGIAVTDDDVPALRNWSLTAESDSLVVDTREIERQANQPSCLYRNFAMGTAAAHAASLSNSTTTTSSTSCNKVKTKQRHLVMDNSIDERDGELILEDACEIDDQGWWTKAYHCNKGFRPPYEQDGPLDMAYKVIDDFVVFKLDSFDGPPGIIFPFWREINEAAVQHGIHKLMIDISSNGGGEVPMGLYLAQLMYPEVSCEMLRNKYDMSYNVPMAIWAKIVAPVLNQLEHRWSEMTDNDKVQVWAQISAFQRNDMVAIAESMCILDLDHNDDFCGNVEVVHQTCPLLVAAQELQATTSTLFNFIKFVDVYLDFMKTCNPWTLLTEFDVHVGIGWRTSLRGGVPTDLTEFLKHEPDYPHWWDCPSLDEVNVFSEYILVSNGNSGSTTSTFQTTVEQVWKNRDISGAKRPATMVSHGGLGQATPLTQFAGGTVDSRVNVEVPYAGLAGLPILTTILSATCSNSSSDDWMKQDKDDPVVTNTMDRIRHAADLLHQTLPQVPYYFAHFSQLPAVEIYNKFLYDNAGETVPLEFLYFPPDHHIRDIYTGSVFDNAPSFKTLYRQASRYFVGL